MVRAKRRQVVAPSGCSLESAAPPVKHEAEVRPVATDASASPACSEDPDASETPALVSLPDDRRTTTALIAVALSPSPIAKNEISIEGRLYVSAARLASILTFRKELFRVDARKWELAATREARRNLSMISMRFTNGLRIKDSPLS